MDQDLNHMIECEARYMLKHDHAWILEALDRRMKKRGTVQPLLDAMHRVHDKRLHGPMRRYTPNGLIR